MWEMPTKLKRFSSKQQSCDHSIVVFSYYENVTCSISDRIEVDVPICQLMVDPTSCELH